MNSKKLTFIKIESIVKLSNTTKWTISSFSLIEYEHFMVWVLWDLDLEGRQWWPPSTPSPLWPSTRIRKEHLINNRHYLLSGHGFKWSQHSLLKVNSFDRPCPPLSKKDRFNDFYIILIYIYICIINLRYKIAKLHLNFGQVRTK